MAGGIRTLCLNLIEKDSVLIMNLLSPKIFLNYSLLYHLAMTIHNSDLCFILLSSSYNIILCIIMLTSLKNKAKR